MGAFRKRNDRLEARLRALGADPRPEFTRELVRRHEEVGRRRPGLRLGVAIAVLSAGLLAMGTASGLGYSVIGTLTDQARVVKAPVKIVKKLVTPAKSKPKPQRAEARRSASRDQYPPGKIPICHRTGSTTNPYVLIIVDEHAVEAHRRHPNQPDIIPAPQTAQGRPFCPGQLP